MHVQRAYAPSAVAISDGTSLTDDQFMGEFLNRPYVFSQVRVPRSIAGLCVGNKLWCMENGQHGFHFFSGDKCIGCINPNGGRGSWQWEFCTENKTTQHLKFADAFSQVISLCPSIPLDFYYKPEPGIFYDSNRRYWLDFVNCPKGTFFVSIESASDTPIAYVRVDAHEKVKCVHLKMEQYPNDPANVPEAVKQCVIKSVSPDDKSWKLDLEKELKLCTTWLDLSVLTQFSYWCLKKVISSFTPNHFQGIEYIILCHSIGRCFDKDPLIGFKEIILGLAQCGVHNAKIYFSYFAWQQFYPQCGLRMVEDDLQEFRSSLKGKELEWALDRYYEYLFYNTSTEKQGGKEPALQFPHVEPNKQTLLNDPTTDRDLEVLLRDSKATISVHKVMLAAFSRPLKEILYNSAQQPNAKVCFIIEQYPDEEVKQLLQVIYGFKPVFNKCKITELLKLSRFIRAESFTALVNDHLNKLLKTNKITLEELLEMVSSSCWTHLPQIQPFFRYVSFHWYELMKSLDEKDRQTARSILFTTWHEFISASQKNTLEIAGKLI